MWTLLVASAMALDLDVGLGAELTANALFVNPVGVRGSVTLRPLPWLGAGVSVAGYPVRVDTTIYEVLQGVAIVPDVAPPVVSASVYGAVRFARGPIGSFDGALDLVVGVGGVYTVDDCAALQMANEAVCVASQRQLHLASAVGLAAEAGRGRWAMRVRGERWAYAETVAGAVDETRTPVWLGAEVVLRFGGGADAP